MLVRYAERYRAHAAGNAYSRPVAASIDGATFQWAAELPFDTTTVPTHDRPTRPPGVRFSGVAEVTFEAVLPLPAAEAGSYALSLDQVFVYVRPPVPEGAVVVDEEEWSIALAPAHGGVAGAYGYHAVVLTALEGTTGLTLSFEATVPILWLAATLKYVDIT